MGFIIEILGDQGVIARKALTHVNTPKGAGVEAEWLLAIYVNIGAVAARVTSHQCEEIFRVARSETAQAAPHRPGVSSGVQAL
jgi:hypothetical protein